MVNEKITRKQVTTQLVPQLSCKCAPYNNRFNPTQRGRHALCSGGSIRVGLTAKVAPEPPFVRPFQAGRMGATASRVNRALYGQEKGLSFTKTELKRRFAQSDSVSYPGFPPSQVKMSGGIT